VSESTWLPNLVGGTSMWKLAVDLNEAKFFDGRLLVPETEGSESLPVTVRWDLTGLIPLAEARTKHADDVAQATKDFQAALERVAKVFATPNSGFDKYKAAFTVPSLDADNGANYFYSPTKKKLFVINWGASPRTMGGKAEYVFGFEDWAKAWADPAALAAGGAAAVATAVAATSKEPEAAKAEEAKKDEKKDEKKKEEKKGRPWWVWPLIGLIIIALLLLALFLLKACEEQKTKELAEAGQTLPDGATLLADGAVLLPDGAVLTGDAGDAGDAGVLADGGDAGDAGALSDAGDDGGDAGKKKHKDGGADSGLDDDDDDDDDATGGGGGGGGGGGKVIVKTFPGGPGTGGGQRTTVHRKHYSNDAVAWRVSGATNKISRTEDSGHRFDVWLNPGNTFEGVRVEWQDKAGKWHVH
jgi:hypothetical protein